MDTPIIYAVCPERACAHVEPRPAHAEHDWFPWRGACGETGPVLFRDPDDAETASQAVLDGCTL